MNQDARIIAVANEKGGVGKTVTVINLGAALSKTGKRVLIVDMDPQANATKGIGVPRQEQPYSIYDLIKPDDVITADEALFESRWPNLHVIPSHVDLAGAEVELVDEPERENRLKTALGSLSNTYDYIFLDTPPSLSLLTVNVFAYAREVLVPCQTHPYSFDALEELFDTIGAVREHINAGLTLTGIVPTFFDIRTRVSKRILDKLNADDRYRDYMFSSIIRTNTTIADSADVAIPVVFYSPSSPGAQDYTALADELMSRPARL